ncbi:hypothetical protein D3OALGA1CA_1603 [Olavius algarvensis associated proteobacterium Delta 3]|nr:hypothetical protein D3OALGA1CA_1603 [Olavius algarvensis associated proteobacterium Delta 3]
METHPRKGMLIMETPWTHEIPEPSSCAGIWRRIASLPGELLVFLILIAAMNLHLLGIGTGHPWIYLPDAVHSGEWWRLVTHPFVHVSWYHLALDAGAFWLLYKNLDEKRAFRKLLIAIVCGGAGLLGAVLFSADIAKTGLCGLSGTAHGLMAYAGLEMTLPRRSRRVGLVTFLLVFVKSVYEAATGTVVFDFMHMGLCGSPLAICHLGGVIGGVVAFGFTLLKIPGRIELSGTSMVHPCKLPKHNIAQRVYETRRCRQ